MNDGYQTLLIDPPWRYSTSLPGFGKKEGDVWKRPGSTPPYAALTIAQLAALPVGQLAARDAHLYLWTTNTHLPDAFGLIKGWGFKYSTTLVWAKRPRGSAGFPTFGVLTEFLLFCRRGTLRALTRLDRNWWELPRAKHSAKPEHFMDYIETVSPAPRLELFARRHRLGWDVMGNAMSGLDIADEIAAWLSLRASGAAATALPALEKGA